jgi:pilus assembly protein CpaD
MANQNTFRLASLLAVLLASSCAEPPQQDAQPRVFEDGAMNHPISAEPVYRSLKLANSQTLSSNDDAALSAFVEEYMARGNGKVSISVPPGPNSEHIITAVAERVADLGVARSHIMVGSQDATATDGKVEVGYIAYEARIEPCGDWSDNAADTFDNTPMPNFGCSVQHNIAAELADPRDISQPRGHESSDATRRMTVLGKYEQGQPTGAQKSQEQNGSVSSVGANGAQ